MFIEEMSIRNTKLRDQLALSEGTIREYYHGLKTNIYRVILRLVRMFIDCGKTVLFFKDMPRMKDVVLRYIRPT